MKNLQRDKSKALLSVFCLLSALVLFKSSAHSSEVAATDQEITTPSPRLIYQVLTDRFYNGRTDNDDPASSPGLFDAQRKNWHAYWGGDLAGIGMKLPYIEALGADAIWISPPQDNVNKSVNDAQGIPTAPYHGYHSRDFKRVEEHFGDSNNSFEDFDKLTSSATERKIDILVDLPFNHTSPYNHGEFGALYDKGSFVGDCEYDRAGYFNHQPLVKDYNNRFQLQYGTIFYLADLNQEHEFIDRYLKSSCDLFRKHGARGTRLDACKHINWGWQHSLANHAYDKGDHFLFGEWWLDSLEDPLFEDAAKFSNESGIPLFDFSFARAVRKAYDKECTGSFHDVDSAIERVDSIFYFPNNMITFIDNHDMPRFQNLNQNRQSLHNALALLLLSRGVPCIYYGTEQYLFDQTNGGNDPYNRGWMSSFDQESDAFKLIRTLGDIRKSNLALHYGKQSRLEVSNDVYIFERCFSGNTVICAFNKNQEKSISISELFSSIEPGNYEDALSGALGGTAVEFTPRARASKVKSGQTFSIAKNISLPPNSVSVWIKRERTEYRSEPNRKRSSKITPAPAIGAVRPTVLTGGDICTIYGINFGDERGKLEVGGELATVEKWSNSAISFKAPYKKSGWQDITVISSTGTRSVNSTKPSSTSGQTNKPIVVKKALDKGAVLKVHEDRLIPVRVSLKGCKDLSMLLPESLQKSSETELDNLKLMLTGNVASLGNWSTEWSDAAGPFNVSEMSGESGNNKFILCLALPRNKEVEFELFILDKNKNLLVREKSSHKYKTPESGTWTIEIEFQK